jgi:prefoldin subunit 5
MNRIERINYLANALKSNADWVEMSLIDYDQCKDLIWSSNERIAEQMVKMGFTTYYKGKCRRSRFETIVQMLEAAE